MVFARLHSDIEIEVSGAEVSSGVPTQPMGVQTIQGAINRARNARSKTDADLGVGIEAGLFKFPYTLTGYLEIQWCAIEDRRGVVTLGCNSGFEHPPEVIEKVLKGEDVEEAIGEISGIERIGETIGAVGFLSKRHIDRVTLTEQAVLMAMIPRIRGELYSI